MHEIMNQLGQCRLNPRKVSEDEQLAVVVTRSIVVNGVRAHIPLIRNPELKPGRRAGANGSFHNDASGDLDPREVLHERIK